MARPRSRNASLRVLLVSTLLLAAAAVGCDVRAPDGEIAGPYPVLDVIDGDTATLGIDGRRRPVRLIGIDAPEVRHPQRGEEPFGREATAYARGLLPAGTRVRLEFDAEREDAYGRLLAYLYVDDPDGAWRVDGVPSTQVNLRIAEAGWARALRVPPNGRHAARIEAAAREAQAAGLGMWGAEPDAPGRGAIAIECALIDPPTANDAAGEWVALRVREPLDTTGYRLWDQGSGTYLPLPTGRQESGELRVGNPGQGIWNNGGDTVRLLAGGSVVDSWTYRGTDVVEGRPLCR